MIDPSIYKVYKQEKKVIIPDFGAIIYSEATDSLDFNEYLSFDDGKVIAEIQSRQKKTKKVAEKALKEHIDKIKAKMDDGKPHLIRGLGYLYRDEEGSYAIQKKKPVVPPVIKEKSAEEKQEEEVITASPQNVPEETEFIATDIAEQEIEFSPSEENIADDIEPDFIIGNESNDGEYVDSAEKYDVLLENEELPYSHKPLLSEEDEDVQHYYKRLDEYEHGSKNRKPLYFIIAAVILVLLLASAAFYYLNTEDKTFDLESKSLSSANISNSEENQIDDTIENEIAEEDNANSSSDTQELSNLDKQQNEIASSFNNDAAAQYDKIYSLILGSFKVESNANNFQEYLVDQGKDVSIFRRGVSSFHFVGYEQIAGKSNALNLLEEMRAEEEPTAWIIRNKQF